MVTLGHTPDATTASVELHGVSQDNPRLCAAEIMTFGHRLDSAQLAEAFSVMARANDNPDLLSGDQDTAIRDLACFFGFAYLHRSLGEKNWRDSSPEPTPEVFREGFARCTGAISAVVNHTDCLPRPDCSNPSLQLSPEAAQRLLDLADITTDVNGKGALLSYLAKPGSMLRSVNGGEPPEHSFTALKKLAEMEKEPTTRAVAQAALFDVLKDTCERHLPHYDLLQHSKDLAKVIGRATFENGSHPLLKLDEFHEYAPGKESLRLEILRQAEEGKNEALLMKYAKRPHSRLPEGEKELLRDFLCKSVAHTIFAGQELDPILRIMTVANSTELSAAMMHPLGTTARRGSPAAIKALKVLGKSDNGEIPSDPLQEIHRKVCRHHERVLATTALLRVPRDSERDGKKLLEQAERVKLLKDATQMIKDGRVLHADFSPSYEQRSALARAALSLDNLIEAPRETMKLVPTAVGDWFLRKLRLSV